MPNSQIKPHHLGLGFAGIGMMASLYFIWPKEGESFASWTYEWFFVIATLATIVTLLILRQRQPKKRTSAKGDFQINQGGELRLSDVAGLEPVKAELAEIVDFLKHSDTYNALGARPPKGVLLAGAPGTGKTMLARAIAGEAGVNIIALSGADFVEIFVGVGSSRVRELFRLAKENSPCIIFIDEIDAVGRARSIAAGGPSGGGGQERENTLNSLLVEMDGFDGSENVLVIAATNRPKVLDKALTRPGRFDRMIFLDKPNRLGREKIFINHLRNLRVDLTEDAIPQLAYASAGASGADIANICNEAALLAGRRGKTAVELIDLRHAIERQLNGIYGTNVVSETQKRSVAVHECGHALASVLLPGTNPLIKVCLTPKSQMGIAFTQYDKSQSPFTTRQQAINQMAVTMAGHAAETLIFGEATSMSSTDFQKVYAQAREVVEKFGIVAPNSDLFKVIQVQEGALYSEAYLTQIDRAVQQLIEEAIIRARVCLEDHHPTLTALAAELINAETIMFADFVALAQQHTAATETPLEPAEAFQ